VKNAGKSPDAERKWQDEQLPSEIKDLILTARKSKKDIKKIMKLGSGEIPIE
jgi:hypothetical protein